jgi:hypothetical protein
MRVEIVFVWRVKVQDRVQKDLKVGKIPVYHVFMTDEKGICCVCVFLVVYDVVITFSRSVWYDLSSL